MFNKGHIVIVKGHRGSMQTASGVVRLDRTRNFRVCLLCLRSASFTERDLFCELQDPQERRWRNSIFLHRQMVSFGGNAGMEGLTHDMVVDGSIHDSVGILAVLWHFRSLGRACMNPWRGVFFFFYRKRGFSDEKGKYSQRKIELKCILCELSRCRK